LNPHRLTLDAIPTPNYLSKKYNQFHILESVAFINSILKEEIAALGGDASKVYLGGFS
jgi:hypothetical protein